MKLVINIPKRVYDYIINTGYIATCDRLEIASCIMNGTKVEEKKNESTSKMQKAKAIH